MTPEEFLALPTPIQIRLMLRANPNFAKAVFAQEAPQLPKPPKFDQRIRRKDGFQWTSETDLEGLRFWYNRAASSENPEFAEKNAKEAKALEYWIRWRECYPSAVWSGERNRQPATAAAPSAKPSVHQWESRDGSQSTGGSNGSTRRTNTRALDGDEDGELDF